MMFLCKKKVKRQRKVWTLPLFSLLKTINLRQCVLVLRKRNIYIFFFFFWQGLSVGFYWASGEIFAWATSLNLQWMSVWQVRIQESGVPGPIEGLRGKPNCNCVPQLQWELLIYFLPAPVFFLSFLELSLFFRFNRYRLTNQQRNFCDLR